MREGFSHFVDLLSAKVPSWDIDYGSCQDLLATAFPAGLGDQKQADHAMDDFMRKVEEALIDEVGFDSYCQRFARRADNGGFSLLPDHIQSRYQGSTPYEKRELFWQDEAPKRYLFHILTTLFGEIFGRQGADSVFGPLWRSFVHNLRCEGSFGPLPVPAGQVGVASAGASQLPTRWSETAITGDLRKLSGNVSALGYYVEKIRERFIIRQDVKTLNDRAQWLEGKLRELKLAQDIQGAAFNLAIQRKEHELRAKQLALQHMQADADLADSFDLAPLRKENSRLTLEVEAATLRKSIRDVAPPEPSARDTKASPEQQRATDKAVCEARIEVLKQERQKALLIKDDQERLLKINAIDDSLQRELERWARLI